MKKSIKKVMSLCLTAIMLASLFCITSLAADLASTAPVHMVQTFDNADLSLWEEDPGYTNAQSVVNGALKVTATNGKLYSYFQPVTDWAYVSFDVRFDENNSSASYANTGIHLGGTAPSGGVTTAASIVATGDAGKESLITYDGKSTTTLVSNIAENEWYNVKVILNLEAQKYNVYVNNTAIATNLAFRYEVTDVFRIQISNKNTVNSFDNFYAGPLLSSISEDFESISSLNGSASPVWTTTLLPDASGSTNGVSATVEADPKDSSNKVLKLYDKLTGTYTNGVGQGCIEVIGDTQPQYGLSSASFKFMLAGASDSGSYNSGIHIYGIKSDGDYTVAASLFYTKEGFVLRDSSSKDTAVLSSVEFNRWYDIKFVFNSEMKTFDLYIDGNLVSDNCAFRFASIDNIARIKFATDSPSNNTVNYIDDVFIGQLDHIEDYAEDYSSDNWATYIGKKTATDPDPSEEVIDAGVTTDPDDSNNHVICLTDKSNAYCVEQRADMRPQQGLCYVNLDVKYAGTKSDWSGFHIQDYTTSESYVIASLMCDSKGLSLKGVDSNGNRSSGSSCTVVSSLESNKWYNFKFVINTYTKTYDVYVDNELIKAGIDFRSASATKLSRVKLTTDVGTSGTVNYYDNIYAGPLKNFTLYKGKGTALKSAEYVSGGTMTVEGYWPEDGNMLYVARYNEDGALQEVYPEAIGASKWGEVVFENANYGDTIQCFLWNETNLAPVIDVVKFTKSEIESCVVTYPDHLMKAVTFNINDGNSTDEALIDLMNTYGINATFGLDGTETNSSVYDNSNFEIANHTTHIEMYLTESYTDDSEKTVTAPTYDECVTSIETAEAAIASKYNVTPTGLVWPYFAPEERDFFSTLKTYAANNGYEYIRDSQVTGSFDVPTDWQDWDITGWVQSANTDTLLAQADQFAALNPSSLKIFSVAGNGEDMTESQLTSFYTSLFEKISGDDIWKATNIEICSYLKASKKLVITSESIYNPTDTTLYMLVNGSPWIAEPDSYAHEVVAD